MCEPSTLSASHALERTESHLELFYDFDDLLRLKAIRTHKQESKRTGSRHIDLLEVTKDGLTVLNSCIPWSIPPYTLRACPSTSWILRLQSVRV